MAQIRKKVKKTPLSKRKYNNTSRSEKSAQTQKAIIEAFIALLVERKGGEVQLQEVAKKIGIAQRTIFRFFKDKRALHDAMDNYLLGYLQSSTQQMETLHFVGFAINAFKLFDQHESLTMAYVLSPFGQETRVLFRKKLTQLMIARIAEEKKLRVTAQMQKRLALVTCLVNAKIWYDLREDFGYSGEAMGDAVGWAIQSLLDNCEDEV